MKLDLISYVYCTFQEEENGQWRNGIALVEPGENVNVILTPKGPVFTTHSIRYKANAVIDLNN